MARSKARAKKNNVEFLQESLYNNNQAATKGPQKKKTWSIHDLKSIRALGESQQKVFDAWNSEQNILAAGSAGTGKTFLALYLGLSAVLFRDQQKVVVVRSAVPTRDIGFMPGTIEEKSSLYEEPYRNICHELIGRASTYCDMKDAGIIEFMTTSYIRGLTLDNTVIIVDEVENLTSHEIDSVMTRVGKNSRIILCGDVTQTDLDGKKHGHEGMSRTEKVLRKMEEFDIVHFTRDDIVRSEFVKSWIIANEETV